MNLRLLALVLFFNSSAIKKTELTNNVLSIPKETTKQEENNVKRFYNTTEIILLSSKDVNKDCDHKEKLIKIPYKQTVEILLEVDVTAEHCRALSAFKRSNNQQLFYLLRASQKTIPAKEEGHVIKLYTPELEAGAYKLYVYLCETGLNGKIPYAKAIIRYNR